MLASHWSDSPGTGSFSVTFYEYDLLLSFSDLLAIFMLDYHRDSCILCIVSRSNSRDIKLCLVFVVVARQCRIVKNVVLGENCI